MTYSSTLHAGRSRFATTGQNAVAFKPEERRLGPISNAIVLLVIICLVGFIYLTQVTKTNQYSYQIQELQTQQTSLKETQKDLELSAARLQSAESTAVTEATKDLVSVAPIAAIENN